VSEPAVNEIVSELARTQANDRTQLEQVLGAEFESSGQNDHWSFYSFELPEGPFAAGSYRLDRAGTRALLSLEPREPQELTEAALDLSPWGEVVDINVNPRIPPEGTDTLVFEVDAVRLAFQFTHHTRELRTLIVRWDAGG
jgi:hypothetical protein